jgi:hypothetical protein
MRGKLGLLRMLGRAAWAGLMSYHISLGKGGGGKGKRGTPKYPTILVSPAEKA